MGWKVVCRVADLEKCAFSSDGQTLVWWNLPAYQVAFTRSCPGGSPRVGWQAPALTPRDDRRELDDQ